jgi:hypothetical protein
MDLLILNAVKDIYFARESRNKPEYIKNVLGGRVKFREVIVSVILSKKKCVRKCDLFRTVYEIELFHCTDEHHPISSLGLQSALMLTVDFSKMYYTR